MLPSASNVREALEQHEEAQRAEQRAGELGDDVGADVLHGIRPPIAAPTETAGLKWAPETRPNA